MHLPQEGWERSEYNNKSSKKETSKLVSQCELKVKLDTRKSKGKGVCKFPLCISKLNSQKHKKGKPKEKEMSFKEGGR